MYQQHYGTVDRHIHIICMKLDNKTLEKYI